MCGSKHLYETNYTRLLRFQSKTPIEEIILKLEIGELQPFFLFKSILTLFLEYILELATRLKPVY